RTHPLPLEGRRGDGSSTPARPPEGGASRSPERAQPANRDPAHPEFWESRYREGVIPWDRGAAPPDFLDWLAGRAAPQRVLVPGCGSAYEVAALALAGHAVSAIDYSPAAVARAREQLQDLGRHVKEADFFALSGDPPWTVVYERAFLCALPPRLWPDYARRMGELIVAGGLLLGYFFVARETGRGPPFAIEEAHLLDLLDPWFALEVDQPSRDPLPVFGSSERWQIWCRRG
ncbi:MAG: methyltransferase domain-containing protein, partial [Betaproteobacteria bacterium]|nr:methyltransferase domain-containing protein [Betaproteobacteria bacterium]